MQKLGPKIYSLTAGPSMRRKMLAKRGAEERIEPGLPQPVSPLGRGLVLEAFENRFWAPDVWLETTIKYRRK